MVGFPLRFQKNIDDPDLRNSSCNIISILHAPSHLKAKGTSKILGAIELIPRRKFYDFQAKYNPKAKSLVC